MSEPMVVAEGVHKSYRMGDQRIHVLRGLDLRLEAGEALAVVGASGVGKSTLLHLLGMLDTPDSGAIRFEGRDLFRLSNRERARRRNELIGFVFQFYHLIPELSALENAMLPAMMYAKGGRAALRSRAGGILGDLGLSERLRHRPSQLSGGERQRVAIARAMVNSPRVLLCDEPTGNLDPETSEGVTDALWDLREREGPAMILVTHDVNLAERADRVLRMVEGRLEG